ncbi:MAG: glycosyltransferase family A protein [Planctomycetota bacterium]
MKFSVITPCYNAERFVKQSLQSAASQTYPPHEVIVVDDGSSDGSLQAIADSGVDVKLLHSKRAGGAGARNIAVAEATGDYLAFLDADDYWLDHHLANAAELLSGTSDVGYTALDHYLYEDGTMREAKNPWPITEPTAGLTHKQYMGFWTIKLKYAMNPTVVSRERFLEVGGFDETQWRRHDIEMWLRVIHGKTWAYNPCADAVYRADTPGSISREKWASSEYYALQSHIKNQERYRGLGIEKIIADTSSRVVACALMDPEFKERDEAIRLAWPHLEPRRRLLFRFARLCPPAFAFVNQIRRNRNKKTAG